MGGQTEPEGRGPPHHRARERPQGKVYRLNSQTAVLIVRPRGWHLYEKHITQNGQPVPRRVRRLRPVLLPQREGSLLARGTGPVLLPAEDGEPSRSGVCGRKSFGVRRRAPGRAARRDPAPPCSSRPFSPPTRWTRSCTSCAEYIAALNCGRWDYIFSFIKKFAKRGDFVLPDRAVVTMTTHFLRSYSLLCIKTCHSRGAFAMGGMAPQIPIKNDPKANEIALGKVRADKEREATNGHDGTWVAHPGLVPIAREVFDRHMQSPNQVAPQARGRERHREGSARRFPRARSRSTACA